MFPSEDTPKQNDPGSQASASRALIERPQTALSTHVQTVLAQEPDDDVIDLRHYWQIVVRRKGTVLTFFAIVVVAAMTATFLSTPIYRAGLTLQIERQEAKVVEYQGVTPTENTGDTKDFYQTQYELLKSRSLAERVIGQLNLTEHALFKKKPKEKGFFESLFQSQAQAQPAATAADTDREMDGAIRIFQDNLTIEPVRNSRLVKLHFDSPDPRLAAAISNNLASAFINVNLERRMEASSYAKTFLQERLQQIKVKLEESEKALVDFARAEQILKSDEGQRNSVDTMVMEEFTTALAKAQQERIRAEATYRQMQAGDLQGLAPVLNSVVIQEFKALKAKLESEYQESLKIYKPSYPKMLQLESRIAEVQSKIDEELANIKVSLRASYEAARAQEDMLKGKLNESKSNVLNVQDRSIQYNILKREVDTNRQLYEGLLQRLKEVGVAGGIGVNNIAVVDKAEVPDAPFKPNVKLNALIAIFLGLFGGVGLAFLFEHLDDSVKQPDDIEKQLGLPVLGIIPMVKGTNNERNLVFEELQDTRSGFAEAYRSVRTALQFATPEGMPKVLMVTSPSMGEGKSTTALALAINMAQAGSKVLLIDADLRKASVYKKLNIDNTIGLTNHLAGTARPADVARPTEVERLFVIPSGPLPPNPAELLGSNKMVALLNLGAEKFDQVIVDGPPVLGLADAPLLGSITDATVLVLESGSTRRDFARSAVKRLKHTRSHLIGGILTKMDTRSQGYGYYHNQYYYEYGATPGKA